MNNFFNEIKSFNELVDPKSEPVYKLAKLINVSSDELYEILCITYDEAVENDELISDSCGIRFSTYFADIELVRNSDFSSHYDKYMRFTLNSNYAKEQLTDTTPSTASVPQSLDEVILTKSNLIRFNKFLTGKKELSSEEIIEQLKNFYVTEYMNNNLSIHKDGYDFKTCFKAYNGSYITLGIKPLKIPEGKYGWILNYVGFDNNVSEKTSTEIEEFAGISRSNYLTDIIALARPEKWFFGDDDNAYEILENYIEYTFYRIKRENKISISCDEKMAAINTGLASNSADDIYMCFSIDETNSFYKWKYAGVCTAARGTLGKQLVSKFNPLPQTACYISRKEDVLYDMDKHLYTDNVHIIIDRIHRIPVAFFRKHLAEHPHAMSILDRIDCFDETTALTFYPLLCEFIKNTNNVYEHLSNALDSIVDKAVKNLRWNYRLAIPCYFPKRNNMSLLLPLDFTDSGQPQAALVAELSPSGNYIGHTILSMKQAYTNARLISSQESSWLKA